MIGNAAMLFRTETGRAPKSLEELAETKCAPGVFGKGDLAHPDGGTYSLSADGMSGVCSKYGRAEALTPIIEHLVTEVSGEEGEEYQDFVREYNEYWRTYFDPIAIRVQATGKQYRLKTLILPLIDNSIYSTMAQLMGGKPVALDALPTGKRELGGMWMHFEKKPLLDVLGPEVARKDVVEKKGINLDARKTTGPEKTGPKTTADLVNDLRQIGIAIHGYHDEYASFPSAAQCDKDGKPLLSWRVAILPFIEQQDLYNQFKLDEPWDSPANKKLIARMPRLFKGLNQKLNEEGKTSFVVPVGKETIFPPEVNAIAINDVVDGTSQTIMTLLADDDSAVTWTKPDDLIVDLKNPLKGLKRKGETSFLAGFADGSVHRFRTRIDPEKLAALFTRAGGEVVDIAAADEERLQSGGPAQRNQLDFTPSAEQLRRLEEVGFDINKLRRFLLDGIGDQIGLHMHDASKLFDFDVAGALGGQNAAGLRLSSTDVVGIGMAVQFVTGPFSVSIPVREAKAVDEFLDELDRLIIQLKAQGPAELGRLDDHVEFYRMPFPKPHTVRCFVVKFVGLKWRLYFGRIGDGLYIANRPFILEDIAAAQSDAKQPRKKPEAAHALLRLRPENWKEVLIGYNLGWAEGHRLACHKNLSMVANVNRGWNDARPKGNEPNHALMNQVFRFYGVRPFCPDGGNYVLSADGKSCHCSVHGNARDPRQPSAPTENSATARLLKSFGGLSRHPDVRGGRSARGGHDRAKGVR